MHILFVPSWYPETEDSFGGTFFREQAEAFVQDGHRVGVLALKTFPIYQALHLKESPSAGMQHSVEAGVGVIRHAVVYPMPKAHRVNSAIGSRSVQKMYQEYLRLHGRPDVLHAHSMFDGGIWAAALSRAEGIPFILTEHRPSSIGRTKVPGRRRDAMQTASQARALVAVSPDFTNSLDAAYAPAHARWQYVPGLLSPQFENLKLEDKQPGEFVFGHVSHLAEGKRVGMLIRAFADLHRNGANARLLIVGGGDALPGLKALAEEVGVADSVDFAGPVARADIVAQFRRMDAFVLPSVAESFGTVIWEAMATGCPIISTQTWAGRNAVREGINGLLTPIDDQQALTSTMAKMLESRDTFDAAQIRRICLEHCGHDEFVRQYMQLYRG